MKRIIKNIFPALKENMPYHHVLLFIYKKTNYHYFLPVYMNQSFSVFLYYTKFPQSYCGDNEYVTFPS